MVLRQLGGRNDVDEVGQRIERTDRRRTGTRGDGDDRHVALAEIGELLPWGVDCATGVEGDGYRKDPEKMKAFVAAVRMAEDAGSEGSKPGENEG